MLSDTAIRKAKLAEKSYKITDERGLHLLVQPTGAKLFQVRYRIAGKEKTASLGRYPDVSLAEARARRDELRSLVAKGVDPVAAKRAQAEAREASSLHTFEVVARAWWAHWSPARSAGHAGYVVRRLEADVFPSIGSRPVADIEAPELVGIVKGVAARGALDIAVRVLSTCNQIFRYAIANGIGGATRNPATFVKPGDIITPRKKVNYARVDARELPTLLRRIEGYQGTPATRLAMKLMALTFVRTGELIAARWDEFDFDAAEWRIPAERMKMKMPHIVPLSRQSVEVLRVLHEVTGGRSLLFPGERDHDKSMSNNTILKALERMGYKGRMTGHGFRGIASTILHEQGFDHAHIELQLAHQERNAVSAAYNHALYLKQRAAMMQAWGDYLEGLTRENVMPLRRTAG